MFKGFNFSILIWILLLNTVTTLTSVGHVTVTVNKPTWLLQTKVMSLSVPSGSKIAYSSKSFSGKHLKITGIIDMTMFYYQTKFHKNPINRSYERMGWQSEKVGQMGFLNFGGRGNILYPSEKLCTVTYLFFFISHINIYRFVIYIIFIHFLLLLH